MLLAALGFSLMGCAAKLLKGSFGAGQLVFWRNAVGLIALIIGFMIRPPQSKGGKFHLLLFRGMMGTTALYTLLYCILHIPLGTAMTYNLTSALFIAVFSFLLFREYHGRVVLFSVLLGFAGMLLVYKPAMHFLFCFSENTMAALCCSLFYWDSRVCYWCINLRCIFPGIIIWPD